MRGYTTNYVNLIADNLWDRYVNGFPILKELIQNADDAKARKLIFGGHEGFPDASHPLLKGPGLWLFNDGEFMEIDGRPRPMRDWELLQVLNGVTFNSALGELENTMATAERTATVDRLKNAFESGLSDHAPTLRRPVCWPEMLFVPGSAASSSVRSADENAATGAG